MSEIVELSLGVQAREQAQAFALAVRARNRALERAAGRDAAADTHDVDDLVTLESARLARHACRELERQDAHPDEVRAVDALEAPGDDRAHAKEPRALRRPIARQSRA